jgi:hypothetical protein
MLEKEDFWLSEDVERKQKKDWVFVPVVTEREKEREDENNVSNECVCVC